MTSRAACGQGVEIVDIETVPETSLYFCEPPLYNSGMPIARRPDDDDPATRILLEVTNGDEHPETDTPEQADYRERVRKDVEHIKRRGGVVDIPSELP